MADLRVTLIQADTVWHDPVANRERLAAAIAAAVPSDARAAAASTDLIVLPETFTTGFSNEALSRAEGMEGPTVAWMRAQAAAHDAAITGSVQIREGAAVFNRLLWVTPDGAVAHYDKRHLFRMSGEHERYAAGRERLVVTWRGWRVLPLVCYDLRFPVYSRNRVVPGAADAGASAALAYDLLLYVANWPSVRQTAWRTLLRARAIENLAYAVGVNRTGVDGHGLVFAGGSAACDFLGETVVELPEGIGTATATLDRGALATHRERFPAHRDADGFELKAEG